VRHRVLKTKIVTEPQDVDARLAAFGVRRQDLLQIPLLALGARNDSVPFDPRTAKGQFSYIYGVRAMRQVFVPAGYEVVSRQNIESVYHPSAGRKIMFQTVDCACLESQIPEAISEIGTGKETVIQKSSGYLFEEMQQEDELRRKTLSDFDRAEAWYLCTAFVNETVTCELSRPEGVIDKQFSGFIERIFILSGDDAGMSKLINLDDDTPPLEIKPQISKR
jgi:hypothetical protein